MKDKSFVLKIWQWEVVKYISYLLVFIVPIYFSNNHWYPFGMPKISLFIGGVSLMLFFYAWGLIKKEKFYFKINNIHIVLFIFLFILTLSSVLGVDPRNSFFGYFAFPTNLIFIYSASIFSIIIGEISKKYKNFLPKILLFSFITSVIVAFFSYSGNSIYKFFTDFSSTIGNSSYTGAYLLFNIFFGIGLFVYYKKIWAKILIAVLTLFVLFCPLFFNIEIFRGNISLLDIQNSPIQILGVANGALLGIIISSLFLFIFALIFSKKKNFKIAGFILFVILMGGILFTSFSFSNEDSSIYQIYVENKTENRFIAWDIAAKSFQERPLLGNGFDNFSYVFRQHFDRSYFDESIEFLSKPHNIVWEYLSNNGVLGLISYLSLFFVIFYTLFKRKKEDLDDFNIFRLVFISILFGYFIQNLFVFDTVTTYLMFFLLLGLSMFFSREIFSFEINNNIKKYLIFLFLITGLSFFVLFSGLPWRESVGWKKLNNNKELLKFKTLRDGLQETSYFGGVIDNAYTSAKIYNFYISNSDKLNDETKGMFLEEIDSVIKNLEKDIKKQPNNYNSYLVLGKLLTYKMFVLGEVNEDDWNYAKDSLLRAQDLSMGDPAVDVALAQIYIYKKDFDNARLSIRQSIAKDPKYLNSYKMAERINKLDKNQSFEDYVEKMKEF